MILWSQIASSLFSGSSPSLVLHQGRIDPSAAQYTLDCICTVCLATGVDLVSFPVVVAIVE